MKKKYKKILVLLILIITLIFVIFFVCKKPHKDVEFKLEQNDNLRSLTLSQEEVSKLVKEYYYNHELVNKDNLNNWEIDDIIYVGYFINNLDNRYYLVKGYYRCNDLGFTCLYNEDLSIIDDNNYYFEIYVAINELENPRVVSISSELNTKDFVSVYLHTE